jgi:hypothetical protein
VYSNENGFGTDCWTFLVFYLEKYGVLRGDGAKAAVLLIRFSKLSSNQILGFYVFLIF